MTALPDHSLASTIMPLHQARGALADASPRTIMVITCEHGGNRIPASYRHLFHDARQVLATHRGYDAGAAALARDLAAWFDAHLFLSTTSRLLVDLNRSIGHPRLYSEFTRNTDPALRREILQQHYAPYRTGAETCIRQAIDHGHRVIHVSSHSFTPVLDGKVRNADIGLLYDPKRPAEAQLGRCWQATLQRHAPRCKTRLNYPYAGTSDGFTAYLRRCFSEEMYAGIEIEMNQKHVAAGSRHWQQLRATVVQALWQTLASIPAVPEHRQE